MIKNGQHFTPPWRSEQEARLRGLVHSGTAMWGPDGFGVEIKVLDQGYVRLVDWMGSDETIVDDARVSTARGFVSWEPYSRCRKCSRVYDGPAPMGWLAPCCDTDPERFPRGDLGILNTMFRDGHTSPFEMVEVKLDVRVPMDAWRQWIRHRTANVNEYSTRYSPAIDAAQRTEPGAWRSQAKVNRQGSGDFLPPLAGTHLSAREEALQHLAREVYEERLAAGVAREQARKDLPLSTYTAARWKCDLHNLLHFEGKRLDAAAQLEIRSYAQAIGLFAQALVPRSWGLFEEYALYGVRLSRSEVADLKSEIEYLRLLERAVFAGDAAAAGDMVVVALSAYADGERNRDAKRRSEIDGKLKIDASVSRVLR